MSGFDISVSGLLAQGRKIDGIARNIANINLPNGDNNLPIDVVDLNVAKTSYEADAKVIKAQDDMEKSLLDIIT
jgi:flagellar basal body rod protein FlgC